jgi:hypothetical protein
MSRQQHSSEFSQDYEQVATPALLSQFADSNQTALLHQSSSIALASVRWFVPPSPYGYSESFRERAARQVGAAIGQPGRLSALKR